MEQEQPPTPNQTVHSDTLAAELAATRRALYALVEGLAWLGFATPVLLFILLSQLPGGLVWPKVFDALHAVLSGVAALVALRISRRLFQPVLRGSLVHYVIAILLVGVLGAGIEVAQIFTHGDPSIKDLVRDLLGALAALACAVSLDRTQVLSGRRWVRWALRFGALVVLARLFYPTVRIEYQLRERAAQLPRLADFESETEKLFVFADLGATLARVDPPTGFLLATGRAGKVTFPVGSEYPKLEISATGDWSKARALAFAVYSDAPSVVRLSVRIDDQHDRRFNTALMIPPGQSTQRIPVEDIRGADQGELDLTHVERILLFIHQPSSTTVLTFDSVQLEH